MSQNEFTDKSSDDLATNYVVVGGGIAAVSCVEELAFLDPKSKITLISASRVVKAASNVQQIGKVMQKFDIIETSSQSLFGQNVDFNFVFDYCRAINTRRKEVRTEGERVFRYDKLCLAMGGKPKLISHNEYVIGIRDTESVLEFQKRLSGSRRVIVVGNGGIASELIYELKNIEIIWCIKHDSILATFVDAGAAHFLISRVNKSHENVKSENISKRLKYSVARDDSDINFEHSVGSALGPDWINDLEISGSAEAPKNVHVEFQCEVQRIITREEFIDEKMVCDSLADTFSNIDVFPVYVQLTNGKIYGCDFVVSATGVIPNAGIELDSDLEENLRFNFSADGGIIVDNQMQTNIDCIYAAGDICTAGWKWCPHWIQMRLWTQAKQMGSYAGKCMFYNHLNPQERVELDLCFEIFTHVTSFFGFKVVLLGSFSSQYLSADHEALLRVEEGEEYVKILVLDGRVRGAVLIGETGLEELLENLILNGTDVTGLDLLNPSMDIEDYFD